MGERLALAGRTPLHWFMPGALHGVDAPIQGHGLRLAHLSPCFFGVLFFFFLSFCFLDDLFGSLLKDPFYLDPLVTLQVFVVLIRKNL